MAKQYSTYTTNASPDCEEKYKTENDQGRACANLPRMENWRSKLRRIMKAKEMRQEDVAQKMACTPGAVSHWLTGKREPSLEDVERLANAVGLTPQELLYGVPGDLTDQDLELLRRINRLTAEQRDIVRALIDQLSR